MNQPIHARALPILALAGIGTWLTPDAHAADAAAQASSVTIGLPNPVAQLEDGANGAAMIDPVRQSLASTLGGAAITVIPLQSQAAPQIDAEATQKHCDYVLYTRIEQRHATSLGGLLHKAAPLASALPMLGALGRSGGGVVSTALSSVTQGVASASASAAQQQLLDSFSGAQRSTIKSGDTLTFEYRLLAPGSTRAVKTDKIAAKARSDGEDVLSPVVARVATAVAVAASSGATAGSSPIASAAPATAAPR